MRPVPRLVGMIHLLPLPGSPGYSGSMTDALDRAVSDAETLAESGFPALMIENFGDVPFFADRVPSETAASMAVVASAVAELGLPFGVNVLRNDAETALGVAAATGATFIRVNVLTGVMYTDQGPIAGRADTVLRKRAALATGVEVWADVMVKHAVPPPGSDVGQTAADTVERGLADAVIASGSATGSAPSLGDLKAVKSAIPEGTRLAIGSGATTENLGELVKVADTVIVGTSLKVDGHPRSPVDKDRVDHFVKVAAEVGLT